MTGEYEYLDRITISIPTSEPAKARPVLGRPARTRPNALHDWEHDAACATRDDINPDWWFPDKGDSTSHHRAIAICNQCPVKTQCLNYALDAGERFGIWGGQSWHQRRDTLRQRRNRGAA